ncbi:MAG: hypothetical protein HYZ29_26845 [Myxococcales bacterium]|nr:hypothetical protein [Myxococcales bacterium]
MLRLRHLALITVGLVGSISAAACGGDSSGDESTGSTDPKKDGARPPPVGSGGPAAGSGDVVIAMNKLILGDVGFDGQENAQAWKKIGYNLDGLISTKNGSNHCAPQKGATKSSVQTDGDDGIDNSFGSNLIKVIGTLAPNPSSEISSALEQGDFTIMLRMEKIEDKPELTGIKTSLYGGAKFDALIADCKATPTDPNCSAPKFDGTDQWPILPELLTNPTDVDSAKVVFPSSYVTGGKWVSGSEGDLDLSLSIQGYSLALKITKAVITADISGVGGTPKATQGIIAGIIPTEQLIAELKKIAGSLSKEMCEGSTFETIAQSIRGASDIMADGTNGDSSKTCDGISIGLGFEGLAVKIGGIAPAASAPKDPCKEEPDAGKPDSGKPDSGGTDSGGTDSGSDAGASDASGD